MAAAPRCCKEDGQIAAAGGGCRASERRLKRRSGLLETPGVAFSQGVHQYLTVSQVLAGQEGAPSPSPLPPEPGCWCRPSGTWFLEAVA